MVTQTAASLFDNPSMTEMYHTMESILVMKELTDENKYKLEVWRDDEGCMLSYVKRGESSTFYALRVFYRDDYDHIAVQFLEAKFGIIAERDFWEYNNKPLCWHEQGSRHMRLFMYSHQFQEFLNTFSGWMK